MERLAQYWDDLDDFVGAIALISEKLRTIGFALLFVAAGLVLHVGGVWLALTHPPLASAAGTVLFVTLLYKLATSGAPLK